MAFKVSKREFEELVEQAISDLPAEFADFLEEVPIEIQDRASEKLRKRIGLKDGRLLLGLYTGVSRIRRSVEDSGRMPDVIYIFQQDHELICNSKAELVEQVRKTVLHEIGHHFGMSEEDLDRLGYG